MPWANAILIALISNLVCVAPILAEEPIRDEFAVGQPMGDPRFGAVEAFQAPQLAGAAGVRWERIVFWWYGLQPQGPGDWNEHYLPDSILEAERSAGRTVVGCLMNPPPWANGTGWPPDPPKNLYLPYDSPDNYWGQFVKRIVTRYKGRIDHWIIGNEPDVWDAENPGYTWHGSVEDYFQFLKVAYQATKAANPGATVVAAGLTYWWDREFGRPQYFQRLLAVARRDPTAAANNWYFDVASLQLYNDPQALYDVPRIFRQIMAEAGVREKPIWITETNVAPWNDPIDPLTRERFRATLDEQAAYTIQAFAYALVGGVERISIYKMSDSPDLPPGVERFGLVRTDGSWRPAYRAFQVVAQYLAGVRGGNLTRDGDAVRIAFEKPDQSVTVIWNASPRPITTTVSALGSAALLVDQRGESREIRAEGDHFTLPLPPATANTVPGLPDQYRIGGPTFLLVERKADAPGIQFRQSPMLSGSPPNGEGWTDPTTGHFLAGTWLDAFRSLGGLDYLGHPRTEVIADPLMGGQTVQYFQRAVLEYHPENAAPFRIQRRLLGDILYPGADAPASPNDAPPGPARYFPFTPDQPTGLGHFVADYTRTGQPVYFKEYFDARGGVTAFGYPKEEPKLRDGRWTQRFQAAVFEYHPENDRDGVVAGTAIPVRNYRVQLALLGDDYIARNGLPFQ